MTVRHWTIVTLIALLFLPMLVFAQTIGPGTETTRPAIQFTPQVPIPGSPGFAGPHPVDSDTIGEYFRALYIYFMSAVGIIAVGMIVYGGLRWLTAAGNPSRIQGAQETITSALIGLVLALTSFLILNTINPNLVRLRIPDVSEVTQQLQTSAFCDQAGVASAGSECGETVSYVGADNKGHTCISTFCDKGNPITAGGVTYYDISTPVCAYNKKINDYECAPANRMCESTDYTSDNECSRVDQQLSVTFPSNQTFLGHQGFESACRKRNDVASGDECVMRWILKCASYEERISCNFKGGADTPCWKDGQPKDTGLGRRQLCSNDSRAAYETDAICCIASEATGNLLRCQQQPPDPFSVPDPLRQGYVEYDLSYCGSHGLNCTSPNHCYALVTMREESPR